MQRSLYAIGDVHGQLTALERALDLITHDGGPDAQIIFLGDYTDRGPQSRQVIERLMTLFQRPNIRGVRGNHDRMFSRFVRAGITMDAQIKSGRTWLDPKLGGNTTLQSYFDIPSDPDLALYGSDPALDAATQALAETARAHVPAAHLDFLDALPLMIEEPGLLFVHAGVNPKVPFGMQDEEDLLWIRDGWLDYTDPLRSLVVHGHTALDAPVHHGNRVNLDGGAGYGRPLVPVVIDTDGTRHDFYTLSEAGRTPLRPH